VIDPVHPTRSAITVVGISGVLTSNCRTAGSNGVNDVDPDRRWYFGGPQDATARATVDRPMPRSRATRRCGTPSATNRRINAQSSTEITHPICLGGLVFHRRYGLVFKRRRHSLYKRPLAVFYLSEPPKDYETRRDFRRLDPGESSEWSAALHSEYRRAHFQRDAVLEIAELDDDTLATDWRIARLPATDAALAQAARERLKSTAYRELPKASLREHDHLGYWTRALENAGVLILATQGGQVAETEMRAFSLYFDEVPVIMLNGKSEYVNSTWPHHGGLSWPHLRGCGRGGSWLCRSR
jgi:hypothetical protein